MSGTGALDAAGVEAVFVVFADLVASHATLLDRLNAFPVPDADTGRNLSATMRAALGALAATSTPVSTRTERSTPTRSPTSPAPGSGPSLAAVDAVAPGGSVALQVGSHPAAPIEDTSGAPSLADLCARLADGAFLGARGNSGTILAQLLAGFLEVVGRAEQLDGATLAAALARAAEVGPLAVAEVVDGTILTVADVVGGAAGATIGEVTSSPGALPGPVPQAAPDLVDVLDAAWATGHQALARTIEQNPVLAAAGVVDAGAAGYLLLLDAFLHVVDGRPLPVPDLTQAPASPLVRPSDAVQPAARADGGPPTSFAGYEVMFVLECPPPPVIDLRDGAPPAGVGRAAVIAALAALGDSVVVTGRPGCWTCHVHTSDIGAVLDAALELGRPRRVRVEPLHPGG